MRVWCFHSVDTWVSRVKRFVVPFPLFFFVSFTSRDYSFVVKVKCMRKLRSSLGCGIHDAAAYMKWYNMRSFYAIIFKSTSSKRDNNLAFGCGAFTFFCGLSRVFLFICTPPDSPFTPDLHVAFCYFVRLPNTAQIQKVQNQWANRRRQTNEKKSYSLFGSNDVVAFCTIYVYSSLRRF